MKKGGSGVGGKGEHYIFGGKGGRLGGDVLGRRTCQARTRRRRYQNISLNGVKGSEISRCYFPPLFFVEL
jgi:hypothetical protein